MYQGLCDHVKAGDAGKPVGKRIVLSNSFVGGNRDMSRRYQDAMACVSGRRDVARARESAGAPWKDDASIAEISRLG